MSSAEQPRARGILWTISRRLAMVIVLAFAFVLSATLTIYVLFRSGDTRVPNLVGKPEAEAQKIAEKAGLRVKIQRRNDAAVPGGSVIETRPGQNSSVKKDSNLTIVVSSGPVQTKSENRSNAEARPGRVVFAPGLTAASRGVGQYHVQAVDSNDCILARAATRPL